MQIESKIKREGGSHIDMGTAVYHFAPLEDGAHVADVENEAHQDRFLSISDGYKLYRGASAPVAAAASELIPAQVIPTAPAIDPETLPLASSVYHPTEFTIHGNAVSLDKVVSLAFEESGLKVSEWNADDARRADLIDAMLDKITERLAPVPTADKVEPAPVPAAAPEPAPAPAPAVATDEREQASLDYQAKFGKKPHHKWGTAKIREEIAQG